MKTLFAVVGGLFLLCVVAVIAFGIAVGRGLIPAPEWLTDQLSKDAGKKMVIIPSTAVSRALPGRWIAENGTLKGSMFTFTSSRRASMTIPVQKLFENTDCTVSGTYYVLDGYLNFEFTSHDGSGCKSDIKEPDTLREKIDMVDDNHMLFGEATLTRDNS